MIFPYIYVSRLDRPALHSGMLMVQTFASRVKKERVPPNTMTRILQRILLGVSHEDKPARITVDRPDKKR